MSGRVALVAWLVLAVLAVSGAGAGAAEVVLVDGAVELRGVGAGEVGVFVEAAGGDVPAMLGEVSRVGGVVRFVPRFGFSAGRGYRVTVGGEVVGRFDVAKVGGAVAKVLQVYPTAGVLPENLLKFYVEFSRPMGRGYAYENLVLRGEDGEVIGAPWLELGEELWDPEGRRFTLFLDPGRVKRGLKPHEEAGPVLVAGKRYTLEVGAGWRDARGEAVGETFVKVFRTVGVDDVQPSPLEWDMVVPEPGTRGALVVTFREALDRGLLGRVVGVLGVEGEASVGKWERQWRFVPDEAWRAGVYALEVGGELEDLAGNSVRKTFEVSESGVATRRLKVGERVEVPFRVGGLPVSWDGGSGEGIAWKVEVAGDGASTPVVSGGRVFLTSQVGNGPVASYRGGDPGKRGDGVVEFLVVCLERSSGKVLWERRWGSRGRLEAVHPLQNLATPSCAVDGERVVAWFGTGQLVCLNTGGQVMWERHLGEELHEFRLKWGHSSSPVVDGGRVYLLCDHDPAAALLVLDLESGEEVWKVERGKGLRSYSTPVLADVGGGRQVIVNSNPGMDGYDAVTGELLWSWKEFCKVPVPVPTVVDGVMTASRGYGNGPVMVLDLGAVEGEVDGGAVEWRWGSKAPYVSSPLVAGELVYLSSENGQVFCVEGGSGDVLWAEKLGTCFWSSPVRADGMVYLFDESGEVVVLREGRELEVVARNPMPGRARGSVVVDGGGVLVRTTAGVFFVKS